MIDLAYRHVVILCSGPSLLDHPLSDLDSLPVTTIGVNSSWRYYRSTAHVFADPEQLYQYRRESTTQRIQSLYVGRDEACEARRANIDSVRLLDFIDSKRPRFSHLPFDPAGGVYLCGSVAWVALQLAAHFLLSHDRSSISFLGLDLSRRGAQHKIPGALGQWNDGAEARQRELFGFAAGLSDAGALRPSLYNVRPTIPLENGARHIPYDSNCWAFPQLSWESWLRALKEDAL